MIEYNANDNEFKNARKSVDNFYSRYHMIAKSLNNATSSIKCIERKVDSSQQSSTQIKKD